MQASSSADFPALRRGGGGTENTGGLDVFVVTLVVGGSAVAFPKISVDKYNFAPPLSISLMRTRSRSRRHCPLRQLPLL